MTTDGSKIVVDLPSIRVFLATFLAALRISVAAIYALTFGAESFENTFSSIALIASVLLFVNAPNLTIKDAYLKGSGRLSHEATFSYIWSVVIMITIAVLLLVFLAPEFEIPLAIAYARFIGTQAELELELRNKLYAIRAQIYAELSVLFMIATLWLAEGSHFLLGSSFCFLSVVVQVKGT